MASLTRFLWITAFFLLAAALISFQIIRQARAYQQGREAYTTELHFENRLLNFEEWFEGDGWENKREAVAAQAAALEAPRQQSIYWSLGFAAILLLYLGLYFRRLSGEDPRTAIAAIIIGALACLITGLLAPMLEIAAYQKDMSIPLKIKTGFLSLNIDYTQHFPGEMYFYYQSKSVIALIRLLFTQHNFVVGISILLFSVLIPIGKNTLGLLALSRRQLPQSRVLRWFLLHSGKWSMADVFVVAIFLGFLAFNNLQTGVQTESHVLTGLYFFLTYVLLAIWASVHIGRYLQRTT